MKTLLALTTGFLSGIMVSAWIMVNAEDKEDKKPQKEEEDEVFESE